MRGHRNDQMSLPYFAPGDYVPKDHPIRRVKTIADAALARLSPVFDEMYSDMGRPSIPPEVLLKSCVLIALFSVRSERQFCEQLGFNMLFRWFLDLNMTDEPFNASSFSKNKERLMEADVARQFFDEVVDIAREGKLLSSDHFTVDGSLIDAWASMKSFRPKDERDSDRNRPNDKGNPTVNFHGEKRSNATHESTTDPEARLCRKGLGKEAKLSFAAHAMMENRNGLLVDLAVSQVDGNAERVQALELVRRQRDRGVRAKTLGADKGYDVPAFVDTLREEGVTPHIAARKARGGIDGRTTRHEGYRISQRCRKRVEEIFGWMKTVGGLRRTRYRGVERTGLWGFFVGAAYNLVRMGRMLTCPA